MKLYEEFKEYENLWEDAEYRSEYARLMATPEGRAELNKMPLEKRLELRKADKDVDPVEIALKKKAKVELEYDGFEDEWSEFHNDPMSDYGFYETAHASSCDDFTFEVEPGDMLEFLLEFITECVDNGTAPNNELINTYKELDKAYAETTEYVAEKQALEALSLFVVENLEAFVEMFYDRIKEHYEEQAMEWALDHCDWSSEVW
jgi:hypothetical protein